MKVTNALDDYIHLRANYWILTGLTGIFLGLFMLSLVNEWEGIYLFFLGGLFSVCAFYSLKLYLKKKGIELNARNISE